MAGLNVTRTPPFGTTDDVRDETEYVLDYTDGGKGLLSLEPALKLGLKLAPQRLVRRRLRQVVHLPRIGRVVV
ncbi:MAG: hypothetical protein ABIF82_03070 [Planctomycetota bacterium]